MSRLPSSSLVTDVLITDVKVTRADATVHDVRLLFDNKHVHAAVVIDRGVLLAVVVRDDVTDAPDDALARDIGALGSRVIGPDFDLDHAQQFMLTAGRRRLAVVDAAGAFVGLLCLKSSGLGFCSHDDIRRRRA